MNDYVEIADADRLDLTNNYTLECWFKADAFGSLRGLVDKYQTPNAGGYFLRLDGNNLDFDLRKTANLNLQTGVWYHAAAVNNNGTRRLYVNGQEVPLTGTAIAVRANTNPLRLGVDYSIRYFNGQMDEVRVWNIARSQAEIVADLAPLTGSEPNLVAYWKLDEGSGTNALDSTTNGHHGALVNGPAWTNSMIPPFIEVDAGLPRVEANSIAWGDYDNDGRLDILLTGSSTGVWRNTGGGFTNINAGLPGVGFSSAAWGDHDNDGRLDILLAGSLGSSVVAQVWRNTGSGFTNINAGLPGVDRCSVAWGDYDNDGRLDILLSGRMGTNHVAQLWRNIGSTANTVPVPPASLAVAMAGSALNFSWNPASDAETPAAGLSYNLRVGTSPGGSDIVSPQASAAGFRRLPTQGSAQQRLSSPLAPTRTGRIYWSVQAVDSAFAGSPFSSESSFLLWPVLGPESGPVQGDANGDAVVDSSEFAVVVANHGMVTQADLDLVLSNYWPYSPWLYLTNVAGLGGTNVTLALSNSTAGVFSVLMSTNLADWDYLGPATPPYEFTDTNAPAEPQRFYRLRWP